MRISGDSSFQQYPDMRISGSSSFQQYPDIQHYDEEIRHLEIKSGSFVFFTVTRILRWGRYSEYYFSKGRITNPNVRYIVCDKEFHNVHNSLFRSMDYYNYMEELQAEYGGMSGMAMTFRRMWIGNFMQKQMNFWHRRWI